MIELKVPEVGESITEVEIAEWLKAEGAPVEKDENVAVLETDKATLELAAPVSGTIGKLLKQQGDRVAVGEVIGEIEEGTVAKPALDKPESAKRAGAPATAVASEAGSDRPSGADQAPQASPSLSARRMPEAKIETGNGAQGQKKAVEERQVFRGPPAGEGAEEAVPMTLLRRRIADRLVQAQHTAALLTTFNEIDMAAIIQLRKRYGESFQANHNAKLGFMSFFVKAAIEALKRVPEVNAEVRGSDIVYRRYYDIGVAVGGGRGLVVPVLRGADRMSFAEIELAIADFAQRARSNKLAPEELQGGTFTISNGGIYGSLLSTPIVNAPQSGVLGLHAIQERPVARDGTVVIRPMMYVALTYDHRIIDGREAVTFLKHVKEIAEDPARMLLEI